MTPFRSAMVIAATLVAATLLFWTVMHQVSTLWLDVALRPEVAAALERSMDDQKLLRSLDPGNAGRYRQRFDELRRLLNGMEVLRLNRERLLRRFELALVVTFVLAACGLVVALWLRQRRGRERERRDYLTRLAGVQETARRHAHEIKGPLTAARLELERYGDAVRAGAPQMDLVRIESSIAEELDRLARHTREVSSVGGIGPPVMRREALATIVGEFCATFAGVWPEMVLSNRGGEVTACADRDMVRQVLVNLCSNSARAGATVVEISVQRAGGTAAIDVRDDGHGIPPSLRSHVFDPYVTTGRSGEGTGLGLAISRKIMIDHGGDLQLISTTTVGTAFRLRFGDVACS